MQLVNKFKEISQIIWDKLLISNTTEETSLTDEVIYNLKKLNSDRLLVIKGKNEKKKGADIEWWIVFPGNEAHTHQTVHMRIQAKKLHMNQDVDHCYSDLDHKKGRQLHNLIDEAIKDDAIPLYCFYNYYYTTINSYQKEVNDVEDGWRYAFADDIASVRENNPSTFRDLSKIDPLTLPMYRLAMLAEMNPYQILSDYQSKSRLESVSHLCKSTLPDYVFEKLEAYEYPNGNFIKQKDWFPEISERRKKNRIKKSQLTVKGIFQMVLDKYMMYLKNREIQKRHLIITISREPMN